MEARWYGVWLDRALSLVTAVVVLAAAYFLGTERVIPALRGEPVRVAEKEKVAGELGFRRLAEGRLGSEGLRVPGERPVLLLVFSSSCPACYANLPAWHAVIEVAQGVASVFAVAVERNQPAALAYARQHLSEAVLVAPEDVREFAGVLGVDMVPFTALVGSDGVVEFVRAGRLDSTAVGSAIRALGVLGGPSNP